MDGGSLDSGDVTNQGLFRWQNGGIGANLTNTGNMVVQTSGNHNLTGSLTNATTGNKALIQQATIRLDASAGGPVVASNQGTWVMEPGAVVTSLQAAPAAVFRNEPGGQILVAPREAGTVAVIDAPFDNNGEVVVGSNSLGSETAQLNLTSKTGVINGVGVLHQGRWIAAGNGIIQFPEPIKVIGPGVFVNGTTANIPALTGLEGNLGEWEVFDAEIFRSVENRGKIFYGHKLVDPETQIEPPKMLFDGNLENKPSGEFESAVDDSDGVTPTALVARSITGLHDLAASHAPEDCLLSEVAIDVGTHSFINEGILRPGAEDDPGAFPLKGDFFQDTTGIMEIDLAGTQAIVEHDQSIICGEAELGGTLDVQILTNTPQVYEPAWGDRFDLLIATQRVVGTFDTVRLPTLESRLDWNLVYGQHSVRLEVVLAGDLNGDGSVDAADASILFTNWGDVPPGDPIADINGDGLVDAADAAEVFANWTGDGAASVPEPSSAPLILSALIALIRRRRAQS